MGLSVCLLPDARAERAVRELWQRLEANGLTSLLSHTHGRHLPHLTLASLLEHRLDAVREAVAGVDLPPLELRLEGLGLFRRSRCWLAPAASAPLLRVQRDVAEAVRGTGAVLHRSYEPGTWVPHVTLAPRLHLRDLETVARLAFEVLPIDARLHRVVLVETRTGEVHAV